MRHDENGHPCPSTLGEYRESVSKLPGTDASVKWLDAKITEQGSDMEVLAPDSQMRAMLMRQCWTDENDPVVREDRVWSEEVPTQPGEYLLAGWFSKGSCHDLKGAPKAPKIHIVTVLAARDHMLFVGGGRFLSPGSEHESPIGLWSPLGIEPPAARLTAIRDALLIEEDHRAEEVR